MKVEIKKPRKLQAWRYSYLVSIPITWCDMHQLGKGSEITFTILEDGSLLLKPKQEVADEKA